MAYERQNWVDGTTICNAERMNHIENGIYNNSQKELNIMEVRLSNDQPVITDIPTRVAFDAIYFSRGNKLTLENNAIKIGAGVKAVRVDLTLWLENNTTNSYAAFYINKNGYDYTYNIHPFIPNASSWGFGSAFAYIDVEEGDIISANVRFSVASNGGRSNMVSAYINGSKLAVQVIE